jgi:hypothetical protein
LITVCSNEAVLGAKLVSPEYEAVIEWIRAASVDVDNVACPPDSVVVPSGTAPSRKVTVPVAALGDTTAVKVTGWPSVDSRAELESEVVVDGNAGMTEIVNPVLPMANPIVESGEDKRNSITSPGFTVPELVGGN